MELASFGLLGVAGAAIYMRNKQIGAAVNGRALNIAQELSARAYVLPLTNSPLLGTSLFDALTTMGWMNAPAEPAGDYKNLNVSFIATPPATPYPDVAYITVFNMTALEIMQLANRARSGALDTTPTPFVFDIFTRRIQVPIAVELIDRVRADLG